MDLLREIVSHKNVFRETLIIEIKNTSIFDWFRCSAVTIIETSF